MNSRILRQKIGDLACGLGCDNFQNPILKSPKKLGVNDMLIEFQGRILQVSNSMTLSDFFLEYSVFRDDHDSSLEEIFLRSDLGLNYVSENYRPTGVGVMVNPKGQVLISQSVKGGWHIPQGGLNFMYDPFDVRSKQVILESPIYGIRRELEEELGSKVLDEVFGCMMLGGQMKKEFEIGRSPKVDEVLGKSIKWFCGKSYVTAVFFVAGEPLIELDPKEIQSVEWVFPQNFPDYGIEPLSKSKFEQAKYFG